MKKEKKIGVTLYNVRDYCRDAAGLDDTLAKLHAIGYRAVQVSGIGPIPYEETGALIRKHSMTCCATHENLENLETKIPDIVGKMMNWQCDFTALGSPPEIYFKNGMQDELITKLITIGKSLKSHGIKFGFHNHHREFQKFDGKIFLEKIYETCPPDVLYAEIDTHWVQRGGGNPVSWIEKTAGRMPVVHFKDFAFIGSEPCIAEIGAGNLEWDCIIAACRKAKVRWYVIEQDCPFMDRDIFTSLENSYKYLYNKGLC